MALMDYDKTSLEKIIDFSKLQLIRSRILGKLMFKTARLENERKKILQDIAEFYCDQYNSKKSDFQPPKELSALFSRQEDIAKQLKAHYQEIEIKAKEESPTGETESQGMDAGPHQSPTKPKTASKKKTAKTKKSNRK